MPFFDQWQEVPDTQVYDNGFKIQWEHFIRHVVENEPYKYTLAEGAKGVQLVEAALQCWKERRWIDVPALEDLNRRNLQSGDGAMSPSLRLPQSDGTLGRHLLQHAAGRGRRRRNPRFNRIAYSAAHVVADPLAAIDPWLDAAIDWDATIAYRQHLWRMGLGVAEAMDTAQRGMGLDWPTSLELIRRIARCGARRPGRDRRLAAAAPTISRPTRRRASTT